ncbi:hypothetical protein [Bacillus wiedmannii]|uniref:hypothetical protein n=1 Tax=Bacillus wiedmannii TaxID=1890302 RepID=UPI000BFE9F29|nr:hypothetical protein [Bacillus wiedmannii]PHA62856.1 hypothetical protein COE75_16590 [Bacillus wiedmannii]
MAKTPYVDLTTEDILSAHISGMAHSINKIEGVLNMKTKDRAGLPLKAVSNQDDVSLQYRIYEGNIRNWTKAVIKRNGVVVPDTEYVIQEAFGVIVFHSPQAPSDSVSADVTHVDESSERLETIEKANEDISKKVTTIEGETTTLKSNVSTLQKDVEDLKNSGGGSGGGGGTTPPPSSGSGYGQHFPLSNKFTTWFNIMPGFSESDLKVSSNILQAANKIDAFPIFIRSRTEVSAMGIKASIGTADGNIILGIYKDLNAQPGELIAQSTSTKIQANSVNRLNFTEEKVSLDVGVYWLARYQTTGVKLEGHAWDKKVHISFVEQSPSFMDGTGDVIGVRTLPMGTITELPKSFPKVGNGAGDAKYLARADIGTNYLYQ